MLKLNYVFESWEWFGTTLRFAGKSFFPIRILLTSGFLLFFLSSLPATAQTYPPLSVVINEVAWSGTAADGNHEWIELYNSSSQPINLTNWTLVGTSDSESVHIILNGTIGSGEYFLLERNHDNVISDISADQIYGFGNGLDNLGERLHLRDPNGTLIDEANNGGGVWPGGTKGPTYLSMERLDPLLPDISTTWSSNNSSVYNGLDANSNPIFGTPKQPNSVVMIPTPTLTPSPTSTLTPTPTTLPTSTSTPLPTATSLPPTPTFTSSPTITPLPPTPTFTSSPTATPLPSTPTLTPLPTATPLPPTPTSTPPPTTIPSPPTPTLTPSLTPTLSTLPTSTPSPTPTFSTPTATQTPSPTLTVSPTLIAPSPSSTFTSTSLILPLTVVINEVAWGGTAASSADEWIELYNNSDQTLILDEWVITSTNGLSISLADTTIGPNAYYLIERSDDNAVSDITADLTTSFGKGLNNKGDTLYLTAGDTLVDTANLEDEAWPVGSGSPEYRSMERIDSLLPDTATNWRGHDLEHQKGQDADGNPINGTPRHPNTTTLPPPPPPAVLLISEFLYDGLTPSTEGDEFVELCNPNAETVDLSHYKIGDEETKGKSEGMYQFPPNTTLMADHCLIIAKNADQFQARFGHLPDFETMTGKTTYSDNPTVPNLERYKSWGKGQWALSNTGDEVVLLGPGDQILDSVAYRKGDYLAVGVQPEVTAPQPKSLHRIWPLDTDSMIDDFVHTDPNPGKLTRFPSAPLTSPPPAALPDNMYAYWGHLHGHTSYSDGAGPPYYALATARAAGLHFYAITDHGWQLDGTRWAKTLTQTVAATIPDEFIALRGLEWTHRNDGHLSILNSDTLLQRTAAPYDELSEIYTWLSNHPEVIAQFNHPAPKDGGTFHDFSFHPTASQMAFLQEVGNNARGYRTYESAFIQSNMMGWQTAPTNNGDTHTAQWGTDTSARTGIVAPALTEDELYRAIRSRRVFATEDRNLALGMRINGAWMGSRLDTIGSLPLSVNIVDFDSEPFTLFLYDGNLLVQQVGLNGSPVQWTTTVEARPGHFFWIKIVQADGDTAYSAPIWMDGQREPETIYINELLPAPNRDWDGNGVADGADEWLELYNPHDFSVSLGGWRLSDTSRIVYDIPLGVTIPPKGWLTFYQAQTGFALNNNGDTVTLTHPNGTLIDTFTYEYHPGRTDSWCRLSDGQNHWSRDCLPTPNEPNQEKLSNHPLTVDIYEAKRLTYNAWVRIKGHVTVPPGPLGDRTLYLQDETAGIKIYLPKDHRLWIKLGDKLEVVGNLRQYYEEFEIVVDERSDVDIIEAGVPPPPLPIATTSLLEPYEGLLVMLQGSAVAFQGRSTMWLDDGTDWAKIYIRTATGIKKPYLKRGTSITIVGVVSQYSYGDKPSRRDYRLLPRYQNDLILPMSGEKQEVVENWPTFLPSTGRWK